MVEPDDDLIRRIRVRAEDPATRTDAPDAPGRLSAPISEAALTGAEARLGFSLPVLLRRLYADIADGGFGPGGGIMKLGDVVRTYEGLTKEPPGPRGQK